MNTRTQIMIVVLSAAALLLLLRTVKKEVLKLRYALPWILVAVGTLICGLFPGVTSVLARLTGIGVPVNFLFFAGFCFLILASLFLTVTVSRLQEKVKILTQELALLKKETEALKKETGNRKEKRWTE